MKFFYEIRVRGLLALPRNGIELDGYVQELVDKKFAPGEIEIKVMTKSEEETDAKKKDQP